MTRKLKSLCIITAVFLLISCLSVISTYASSGETDSQDSQSVSTPSGLDGSLTTQPGIVNETDEDQDVLDNSTQDTDEDSSNSQDQSVTTDNGSDIQVPNQPPVDIMSDPDAQDQDGDMDLSGEYDLSPEDNPVVPPKAKEDESLWYSSRIPMKKEHQKLLYDYCKSRKLVYLDTLSIISTESNFIEKSTNGKFKGYFQISCSNGLNLSKIMKTPNNPLDGKININWGTAILDSIQKDKRVKNLTGKKRRDVILSIFQRGTAGYDRYGISTGYLKAFYRKLRIVQSYFKKS